MSTWLGCSERAAATLLTVLEAGLRSASDEEHLARAQTGGYVLFTHDDAFLRLHATGFVHSGIVYAHQGTAIGDIIRGLMLIHQLLEPEDMQEHVEYL